MTQPMTSSTFQNGLPIPRPYTGEGENLSPELSWSDADVPAGTREFALICEDPDAPTSQPYVHWVLYKIPADVRRLAAGVSRKGQRSALKGARDGMNSFRTRGYCGPMPPPRHGAHRYFFRLYALDTELDLPEGATKDKLVGAMRGHVLGEWELMGRYERH